MQLYKSNKEVSATPMKSQDWVSYRKDLPVDTYSDATLPDGLEGYLVVYSRNTNEEYWSWSPKAVFEEGYDEVNPLNNMQVSNNPTKYA